MGRLLVTAILTAILFLSHALPSIIAQQHITSLRLDLQVYQDGAVHVLYHVQVNASLPTVNVTLLGFLYENILVVNENKTFLDYLITGNVLTIDSLGSQLVVLEYDALDLTNKTHGIWALALNTPTNVTITFPVNTTIIDLSVVPLEIVSHDHQTILTLPMGLHSVSYIVATLTPQEEIRDFLDLVATIIAQIQSQGIDTSPAEALLQQAEAAFTQGDYLQADNLGQQALTLVLSLEPSPIPSALILLLAGGGMIGVLSVLLFQRGRRIDVNTIVARYPWLREDQKAVIRYLAQHRSGVYEAQLREVFHIPKSSMWRLIKKLEEAGILTVTQHRRQNFIRIRIPSSPDPDRTSEQR